MINVNNMPSLPAYVVNDIVSMGTIYKKDDLYSCRFIRQDNLFLQTGAIKLLPFNMSNFNTNYQVILNGKKYDADEEVNPYEFEFHVLKTLVKNNIVKCTFKEEYTKLDSKKVIELSKTYDLVGKTFKEVSEILNIPFETLKEKFDLKQGGHKKKITLKDLEIITNIQ